jgi:hypothetical protein
MVSGGRLLRRAAASSDIFGANPNDIFAQLPLTYVLTQIKEHMDVQEEADFIYIGVRVFAGYDGCVLCGG